MQSRLETSSLCSVSQGHGARTYHVRRNQAAAAHEYSELNKEPTILNDYGEVAQLVECAPATWLAVLIDVQA